MGLLLFDPCATLPIPCEGELLVIVRTTPFSEMVSDARRRGEVLLAAFELDLLKALVFFVLASFLLQDGSDKRLVVMSLPSFLLLEGGELISIKFLRLPSDPFFV